MDVTNFFQTLNFYRSE